MPNTVTDSRVQRDKASKESAFIVFRRSRTVELLAARETLADKLLWRQAWKVWWRRMEAVLSWSQKEDRKFSHKTLDQLGAVIMCLVHGFALLVSFTVENTWVLMKICRLQIFSTFGEDVRYTPWTFFLLIYCGRVRYLRTVVLNQGSICLFYQEIFGNVWRHFKILIYLTVLGLNCGIFTFLLWHGDLLIVACQLSVAA